MEEKRALEHLSEKKCFLRWTKLAWIESAIVSKTFWKSKSFLCDQEVWVSKQTENRSIKLDICKNSGDPESDIYNLKEGL